MDVENLGIIQAGVLKAAAPPQQLIRAQRTEERVLVSFRRPVEAPVIGRLNGISQARVENGRFILFGPDASRIAASVASYAENAANSIEEMKIMQASLEDVYLTLTSHAEGK